MAQTVDFGPPIKIAAPSYIFGSMPKSVKAILEKPSSATSSIALTPTYWLDISVSKPSLGALTPIPNQVVAGSFTVASNEPVYGLKYAVVLAKKDQLARPAFLSPSVQVSLAPYAVNVADYKVSEQTFSLLNTTPQTEKFSYAIPAGLSGGDYILWMEVIPPHADAFVSQETNLKIQGKVDSSFSISNPYFVEQWKGKVIYSPAENTPTYDSSSTVKLIYQLNNIGSFAPRTKIHVQISKNNAIGDIAQEFYTDIFSFEKGKHSLIVSLPRLTNPGKYFVLLTWNGSTPQNPSFAFNLSSKALFDVAGPQGVIKNVVIQPGRVIAVVGAPLDSSSTLSASLDLNISDTASGQTIFQETKPIILSGASALTANPTIIFEVSNAAASDHPAYELTFFKDANVFDKYELQPNGSATQTAPAAQPGESSQLPMLTIIIIIAVIVLILGGLPLGLYFYFRKKDSGTPSIPPGTPLIVLAVLAISFLALLQKAEAATWMYLGMSGFPDYSASPDWGGPADGSTYLPGQAIVFSGGGSSKVFNPAKTDECPLPEFWPMPTDGAVVVSDGFPSSPSTLNTSNIDSQFSGTNYVSQPVSGSGIGWYKRNCFLGFQTEFNGSITAPANGPKGYFDGLVHAFLIWSSPGWNVGYADINIDNPQGFNYKMSADDVAIAAGSSGSTPVRLKLLTATSSDVSVSLTGAPPGVTDSFTPASECSPDCNLILNLNVDFSVPIGLYPLTVTGSPLGRTATLNLQVQPAKGIINYFKPGSASGGFTPLLWSVSNFNSCDITDAKGATVESGISGNGTGSVSVPSTVDMTYTLTCNPGNVKAKLTISHIIEVIPR